MDERALVQMSKAPPPFRQNGGGVLGASDPDLDSRWDQKRCDYALAHWHSQDTLLRPRDRQVEENVRMLAGQHWSVYDPKVGSFIDPSRWMTDAERRWRMRPVLNRILPWYILTHARLTENSPIVTFLPGPDRADAILAETMDVVYKTLWRELGMDDINDRLMAWLICGGRSYLQTRVDLVRGPMKPWRGWAEIPLVGPDGPVVDPETGQPALVPWEDVPFDAQGNPLAVMTPDGPMETGKAHETPEGMLAVDVFSAPEVRGQWGPQPWHLKAWHMTKAYLTPAEVFDQYGEEVEPDVTGHSADETGELQRLLFGSGYFGAADGRGALAGGSEKGEGYCEVYSLTEAPRLSVGPDGEQGYIRTTENPGGRLLVCTRKRVLRDGPRPVAFPYTSSLRAFGFVRLPGRPHESTPQEALNPINRAINRHMAQVGQYANLCTNPIHLIDAQSGLQNVTFTNEPGVGYDVNKRPGVQAVEWISPPPLGADVYKALDILHQEFEFIGNLAGTEGDPPTRDASGELVKELRFNTDRFLGPTSRRNVTEYGRHFEDWMVLLPTVWDSERIVQYAGEDNVARTLAVMPEMLTGGKVNVVPDLESMLPEGRGERQARIWQMYGAGMFGLPGSPQALKTFYEHARFPHLSRTAKVGGVDATTAEQFLGMVVQGAKMQDIPYFDWYDCSVHLMVFEQFMKGPEFLRLPPPVMAEMAAVRERYVFFEQMKLMKAMAMQNAMAPGGPEGEGGGVAPEGGDAPGSEVRPEGADQHAPAEVPGGQYPTGIGAI